MKIMGHMNRTRKGITPSTNFTTEQIMNDKMEQEPQLELARGNLYINNYIGVNAITFDDLKGILSMDLYG